MSDPIELAAALNRLIATFGPKCKVVNPGHEVTPCWHCGDWIATDFAVIGTVPFGDDVLEARLCSSTCWSRSWDEHGRSE